MAFQKDIDLTTLDSRHVAITKLEKWYAMGPLCPIVKDATVCVLKNGKVSSDILDAVATEQRATMQEDGSDNDRFAAEQGPNRERRNVDGDDSISSKEREDDPVFLDEGHHMITTRTIKVACTPIRAALVHLLRNRPFLYKPENLMVNQQPSKAYFMYESPTC